jgi:cyclase
LKSGADKIVINTEAYRSSGFIEDMARAFGSQCVVVSIDSKKDEEGIEKVCIDRGKEMTNKEAVAWALEAAKRGAGELFVNSIDYDGKRKGYNLNLMRKIVQAVSIPVIAFGGVFKWQDMLDGIIEAGADAVAAANILHYTEHSCRKAKRFLVDKGIQVRK